MSESIRRQICCLKDQLAALQQQVDALVEVDNQVISLAGNILTLSGGLVPDTVVDLSAFLDNTDDQVISAIVAGPNLVIGIEDGNVVNVPLSSLGSDDQLLTLVGTNLSIEDGNTIDLSQFEETLTTTDVTRTVGFAEGFILDNGSNQYVFNATATRTAVGRYTVTFNTPHPAGVDYSIQLTLASDEPNRDQRKIAWTNKNAGFFQVVVTADDNGGAADFFVDETFDFRVNVVETLVTSAVLT